MPDIDNNEISLNLMETVNYLAGEIGQRSFRDHEQLAKAADFIEKRFLLAGCRTEKQPIEYNGNTYYNVACISEGNSNMSAPVLIIGAHFDTVSGTPGADDNASGVAVLLELARLNSLFKLNYNINFVAFCLEEPPSFGTSTMGSYHYARALNKAGTNVWGMLSLEMLGYYCQDKGCQLYPVPMMRWLYPDRGDYISLVGNLSSRGFTRRFKKAFENASPFPVESINTFSMVPGIDFSDHRNFWKFGYPAFMVTDTAFYRNPNYHSHGDTPETLDYDKMAELTAGLFRAMISLKP